MSSAYKMNWEVFSSYVFLEEFMLYGITFLDVWQNSPGKPLVMELSSWEGFKL